ncbi:uncharacterized protein PFL1_05331 [Pseudozyma flocculosa PF-1]|nr:uncharacterized protein PFL1_05331 [Pseudozyma flocculosa PF-1]EPQ27047.1 hypothetical protein PFL1_05331 [Pseudozyma flocculosa PF-1]
MRAAARSARDVCRGSSPWPTGLSPSPRPAVRPIVSPLTPTVGQSCDADRVGGAEAGLVGRSRRFATAATTSPFALHRPESSWSMISSPYSTRHPAGPLPGSNNELDPRGVDYSLFEKVEAPSYKTEPQAQVTVADKQRRGRPVASIRLSTRDLTPEAALLRRLIRQREFQSAAQVLGELRMLETPMDQHIPEYLAAAIWSVRNARRNEALQWMAISPALRVATSRHKPLKPYFRKQNEQNSFKFRKLFALLLDTAGDDLEMLQKASLLAARKGYWDVLYMTLAQIFRYGLGVPSTSDQGSKSRQAWTLFQGLVERVSRDSASKISVETLQQRTALTSLYRQSVRTLVLSGRLEDAAFWIERPLEPGGLDEAQCELLRIDQFTYALALTRLLEAGPPFDQLAMRIDELASKGQSQNLPSLEWLRGLDARPRAEPIDETQGEHERGTLNPSLETQLSFLINTGELVQARAYLLACLDGLQSPGESPDEQDVNGIRQCPVRLPSASALANFQQAVVDMGSVVILPSLLEDGGDESSRLAEPTVVEASEFLRPVQEAISECPTGTGLWETAQLLGLVRRGMWEAALSFFAGPSGFRLPAGGITDELIALATGGSAEAAAQRWRSDGTASASTKNSPWPGTHAINLAIRALVGACLQARDFGRLEKVYAAWKEGSLPPSTVPVAHEAAAAPTSTSTATRADSGLPASISAPGDVSGDSSARDRDTALLQNIAAHVGQLRFQHWTPGHRPDSFTFDPFLRAFALRHMTVQEPSHGPAPASQVGRSIPRPPRRSRIPWGSGERALAVVRDMTTQFGVQPSVASWTIVLESMAREGIDKWQQPTERLANAMGIRTRRGEDGKLGVAADGAVLAGLPAATLETYTALLRAMLRVPRKNLRQPLLHQATLVRDDLLSRIELPQDIEEARRSLSEAVRDESGGHDDDDDGQETGAFVSKLLDGIVTKRGNAVDDGRKGWPLRQLLDNRRTIEVLRDVYLAEVEAEPSVLP